MKLANLTGGVGYRLARTLVLALLVIGAGLGGRSLPANAGIGFSTQTLEQSETGFRIKIIIPEAQRRVVEPEEGGIYHSITIPEFFPGDTRDAGAPDLPRRGVPFGLPEGARARIVDVQVLASDSFDGFPPLPIPERRWTPGDPVPSEQLRFVRNPEAYARRTADATPTVELGRVMGWRHQRVQSLIISPVQVAPSGGLYQIVRELEVEVRFDSKPSKPTGSRLAPLRDDAPGWDEMIDATLVNAASARRLRTRAVSPPLPAAVQPGSTHIRLRLGGSGLTRISFATLAGAGWPAGIPVTEVRVVERGYDDQLPNPVTAVDLPRRVEDNNQNSVFDDGDYVYFYGFNYQDRFSPSWTDFRFTYYHTYWVSHTGDAGLELAEVDGYPAGIDYVPVASFPHRDEYNNDEIYTNSPEEDGTNLFPTISSTYWLNLNDVNTTLNFDVRNADPAGNYQISAHWQGWDATFSSDEHYVSLDVNGLTILDEFLFRGTSAYTFPGTPMATMGTLVEGSNNLTVRGHNQATANRVGAFFDWFTVTYDRLLQARNDVLVFNSGGNTGRMEFAVPGFSDPGILVLDITDPMNPVQLNGQVEDAGGSHTVRIRVDVTGGTRRYVAVVPARVEGLPESRYTLSPDLVAEIAPGLPRDLLQAGAGGDYILISHPEFEDAWAPLVQHRESLGHRVFQCNVLEIYDQFSGGDKTPWAIQRFLTHAYRTWSPAPSFLFLAGDGNEDYRKDVSASTPDWIPTMMHRANVRGDRGLELAGTDTWYAAFLREGDNQFDVLPEMHVARVPCGDRTEVEAFVQKLLHYETTWTSGDDWRKRLFFLSDDQYSSGITLATGYQWKSQERSFRQTTEAVIESLDVLGKLTDIDPIHFSLSAHLDTAAAAGRNPGPGDTPELLPTQRYTREIIAPLALAELSRGHFIFEYTGHANNYAMATETLFQHRDTFSNPDMDRVNNNEKPFIFMGYACHLMEFESAREGTDGPGIGGALLKAPNSGAIAVMASTGFEWLHTNPFVQLRTSRALFWDLPRDPDTGRPRRLFAETMTRAFAKLVMESPGSPDFVGMIRTYQSFTDPALRVDIHTALFSVDVDGVSAPAGTPLLAASFTDSLSVAAVISDDVDVSTIRVLDGSDQLPEQRVSVVAPAPTDKGAQFYEAAFKTVLRLGNYDLTIEATDWAGRVSTHPLLVRVIPTFTADGQSLDPGIVNAVDRDAVLRAEVDVPVPLEAGNFELLINDSPVIADIQPLDGTGRRWGMEVVREWAQGSYTAALRTFHPQGGEVLSEVSFQIADELSLVDAFFYPNPYEEGPASLVYEISETALRASLSVYTVSGRRILRDEHLPTTPGRNAFQWDLRDAAGDQVANGVYLFVLQLRGDDGEDIQHIERVAVTR